MRHWGELVSHWGSTPGERHESFPCDALVPEPHQAVYRAVDVDAPAAVVYRWLCQLRVAPYSYDWIDNLGRLSPPRLIPGVDHLERGQRIMSVFRLEHFEPGRSITMLAVLRHVGRIAVTYRVKPAGPAASRLVAKLAARYQAGHLACLVARVLPAGDLVMMRRQLLNLKRLAERQPSPD